MNLLINIVIGFIAALIVKYILDYFAIPNPIDWLVTLVVFLMVAFGANRWGGWR